MHVFQEEIIVHLRQQQEMHEKLLRLLYDKQRSRTVSPDVSAEFGPSPSHDGAARVHAGASVARVSPIKVGEPSPNRCLCSKATGGGLELNCLLYPQARRPNFEVRSGLVRSGRSGQRLWGLPVPA